MKPLIVLIALLVLAAPARADLPKVPTHAKRLTRDIAYNAAWNDGMRQIKTDPRWVDGAVLVVQTCRVRPRRGWCEYTLSSVVRDPATGYVTPGVRFVCRRRETTRISRSFRVSSRSKALGCKERSTTG